MATVDGITAEKAAEIENASVVSGSINIANGHLILTTAGGTEIDAGQVVPDVPEPPYCETKSDYASGDLSLGGGSSVAIPGLSVEVTNPGDAVYVVTLDVALFVQNLTSNSDFIGEVYLQRNGVNVTPSIIWRNNYTDGIDSHIDTVYSRTWVLRDLDPGLHTFTATAIGTFSGAGPYLLKGARTHLVVLGRAS